MKNFAQIKILYEGYLSNDTEGHTAPTIVLVQDENLNIIVDPGVLLDQQILVDKLKDEGLTPDDIDLVFITHSHLDHYRNIGMFSCAKSIASNCLWSTDTEKLLPKNISKNIKLLKTPGHSNDSLSMLVQTENGLVAICGDVFWKEDFPQLKNDPYATNRNELVKSRAHVLKLADYIIPGHGPMY